jgi:hypothetical protein
MSGRRFKVAFEVIHDEHVCSQEGCTHVVNHWAQPVGYVGPVYCIKHAANARRSR